MKKSRRYIRRDGREKIVRITPSTELTRQTPNQACQTLAQITKISARSYATIVARKFITAEAAPNPEKILKTSCGLGNLRVNDGG